MLIGKEGSKLLLLLTCFWLHAWMVNDRTKFFTQSVMEKEPELGGKIDRQDFFKIFLKKSYCGLQKRTHLVDDEERTVKCAQLGLRIMSRPLCRDVNLLA